MQSQEEFYFSNHGYIFKFVGHYISKPFTQLFRFGSKYDIIDIILNHHNIIIFFLCEQGALLESFLKKVCWERIIPSFGAYFSLYTSSSSACIPYVIHQLQILEVVWHILHLSICYLETHTLHSSDELFVGWAFFLYFFLLATSLALFLMTIPHPSFLFLKIHFRPITLRFSRRSTNS